MMAGTVPGFHACYAPVKLWCPSSPILAPMMSMPGACVPRCKLPPAFANAATVRWQAELVRIIGAACPKEAAEARYTGLMVLDEAPW